MAPTLAPVPLAWSGPLDSDEVVLLVLAIGVVLGGLAKAILGPRSSLSWPAAILSGIVGAGIGGPLARWLVSDRLLVVALASMAVTILTLLVAERWTRRDEPVAELLARGEGPSVEFKSTARANPATGGGRDERLEAVIAKTIAGFANASGGTLLIGVNDAGEPLGLAPDLALMKAPDHDRYELWLRDLLTTSLGPAATAPIRVEFPEVGGTAICVVRVPAAGRPVFLRPKGKPTLFVARVGNSTREFPVDEALAYVGRHWRFGLSSRRGRARG